MNDLVTGYIPKFYQDGNKCGDGLISKRTIQIEGENITPKQCKKLCDNENECKYFFFYYNPAEGVTNCETFKTCDQLLLTDFAGSTYEKVEGRKHLSVSLWQ